jgi:transposase
MGWNKMEINRSSKLHINHLTKLKKDKIQNLITEYSRLCNIFISKYENKIVNEDTTKYQFLALSYVNELKKETWFSSRIVQDIIAESYSMILGSKNKAVVCKEKYVTPKHTGKKILLSSKICKLSNSKNTKTFDFNVELTSIGNKEKISIPLKKHRQFNKWNDIGKLNKSIMITTSYIQVSFEIETGKKKEDGEMVGIDLGLKNLLTCSNGELYGCNIENKIMQLNNKKRNSKSWKRKKIEIKEYINQELKKFDFKNTGLLVVEKLKDIKQNMKVKRRLTKTIRAKLSHWNSSFVLNRIQSLCEENRVSFRSVPGFYTSQTCSKCGYRDKKNRINQSDFKCQSCGHTVNADFNASLNILNSALTGKYGFCFKG